MNYLKMETGETPVLHSNHTRTERRALPIQFVKIRAIACQKKSFPSVSLFFAKFRLCQ
jgi:hypothetical protein